MNDGGDAFLGGNFDSVGKGKECVRRHYRSPGLLPSFLGSDVNTIHPVWLSAAYPNRRLAVALLSVTPGRDAIDVLRHELD
ncbi:MAG: hypothetical protein E3J69_04750 [Anaerolineales bacterium]|nr:MAG: hypothetical protein E3J69_04750 [Anaerolineales bacterium]